MKLPRSVKLVEVSPRDGLQNETTSIPTAIKIEMINRLSATGLSTIEVTSFVSPKKIPQLADSSEVCNGIDKKIGVAYPVLIPNLEGLKNALAVGTKEIAVFTAASETFSNKNINCSIAESLIRIEAIIKEAKRGKIPIRGYISCAVACPYEGEIDPAIVAKLSKKLIDMGCYEISLGDTIGTGTPGKVVALIDEILKHGTPIETLAMHCHDTYGQALANNYAAFTRGISIFDASVAGLGGCPYAKGATGNVATEDLLYMFNGLNVETGVDLDKLIGVGNFICRYLQTESNSKVAKATTGN